MQMKRSDNDWVCACCEFLVMAAEYKADAEPVIQRCELCAVAMCSHHMFKVPKKDYSMCTGCKSVEHGMFEDGLGRKHLVPGFYKDTKTGRLIPSPSDGKVRWENEVVELEEK